MKTNEQECRRLDAPASAARGTSPSEQPVSYRHLDQFTLLKLSQNGAREHEQAVCYALGALWDVRAAHRHSQYSRSLAVLQEKGSIDGSLSPEDIETMEEMMLVTSVGGSLDGLTARMLHLIRGQDADAVIRLYHRYEDMMQASGFLSAEEDEDAVSEAGEEGEEPLLAVVPAGPTRYIRGEILFFAIVACAMKDSFSDALRVGVRTPATLHIPSLKVALAQARLTPSMNERVTTYLRQIALAKLFSRYSAFSRHIANLTRSKADKLLERTYTDMMHTLRDPQSGVVLDPSAVSERSPILFPDFAWTLFLTAFLKVRQVQMAQRLWRDMNDLGVKPSPDVWAALLEGYGGLRLIEQARGAWSVVLKTQDALTHQTYKAIIVAEYQTKHPEEAMKRFLEFEAQVAAGKLSNEHSDRVYVYNTVFSWLLKLGKEAEAVELLKRMQAKGPAPDIVSYNTLLRHHAKQGNLRALAAVIKDMSNAAIAGDIYTYSTVLSALAPVRQDAIQIVLDMMKKHGIEPNVTMYTTIITNLMRQHTEATFRAALNLLYSMEASESKDMQPNVVTYTSILAAIHRKSWLDPLVVEETTQNIAEKMVNRDLLNSRVTYNILIRACLDNPAPEGLTNAFRYYRDMASRRVYIDADTWHILLSGLLSRKEYAMANELVDEILRSGYRPTAALRHLMRTVRRLNDKYMDSILT